MLTIRLLDIGINVGDSQRHTPSRLPYYRWFSFRVKGFIPCRDEV